MDGKDTSLNFPRRNQSNEVVGPWNLINRCSSCLHLLGIKYVNNQPLLPFFRLLLLPGLAPAATLPPRIILPGNALYSAKPLQPTSAPIIQPLLRFH